MSRGLLWVVGLALLVSTGCAGRRMLAVTSVGVAGLPDTDVPSDWRSVARSADQAQLDDISGLWAAALSEVAKSDSRALVQEGALLRADAALPRAVPTPGLYRCRSVRIGRPEGAPAARALTRLRPFDCVVTAEQAALGFTKVSGLDRPGGYLWADGAKRMVFLGGTAERDGEAASAYGGADAARNRFGVFERIGEFRWRLTLVVRASPAVLEVVDLVPAVAVPVRVAR